MSGAPLSPQMTNEEVDAASRLIALALEEDLAGQVDLTAHSLIPPNATGSVAVVSRMHGILSGSPIAAEVFRQLDPRIEYRPCLNDGQSLGPGAVIAQVSGPTASLLSGERTALNFLTLLSGVATLTGKFVDAVAGTSARILDTRKTLPGLRRLQKYAVRCGGGVNHRMGLYDAVLIKDNHLAWRAQTGQGKLSEAIAIARGAAPAGTIVEIEVDSLEQFDEALSGSPDLILLDNMSLEQLRTAVNRRDRLAPDVGLEASGGVTLETVGAIARTGVDRISAGALTHSAPAVDIGLDWRTGPDIR